MQKRHFLSLFFLIIFINGSILYAKEVDDSFLMQDFQEPIPEFVRETTTVNTTTSVQQPTAQPVVQEKSVPANKFSVKRRTYLLVTYGPVGFAGGSELDTVLKNENNYYKTTYGWNKSAFSTPITQGLTGGIEVRKGWSDQVMIGLSVQNVVGKSSETTIKSGANELVADAKFEITTTFVNAYFYNPISTNLEYYIGLGMGIGQGIVGYSETFNNTDFESKLVDKASGAQVLLGLDWKLANFFILETNLFYRAMELRNVSLTGGGLTLGLVVPF